MDKREGLQRHRGVTRQRRLIIMVKEPVAGRVKTRLASHIGSSHATNIYRHMTDSVIARLASDPRWRTLLSVAPISALKAPVWQNGLARLPQSIGDIGVRMQALLNSPQAGPMIIVGTDIPKIQKHHIAQAFQLLGANDIVFGPVTDGGFWLIGMHRSPRILNAFSEVRWSTAYTLEDCLRGLKRHKIGFAATLRDVDDLDDLAILRSAIGRNVLPVALGPQFAATPKFAHCD